jgi:hypothetical protein
VNQLAETAQVAATRIRMPIRAIARVVSPSRIERGATTVY